MEGNEPVVIPNAEGKRTTPSVIAFVEGGRRRRSSGGGGTGASGTGAGGGDDFSGYGGAEG
jgi:hypothetical protein